MSTAGLLAKELESLVLDESNDDNQLEDFDFEVVEEDVSLSAALFEVSEILLKWIWAQPWSLVRAIVEKVETYRHERSLLPG